jgi:hypothetical protein
MPLYSFYITQTLIEINGMDVVFVKVITKSCFGEYATFWAGSFSGHGTEKSKYQIIKLNDSLKYYPKIFFYNKSYGNML